jgi:sensor histidine kinase YesM
LQPLIENAIKYAIAPSETGGRIAINGRTDNGNLILTIEDTGPGMVDTARIDDGRGVGLRNTRDRLRAMFGNRAKIEFENTNPGLRIMLIFPTQSIAVAHP